MAKATKKRAAKSRVLHARAVSGALATDIIAGRTAYPHDLMPLSRCKTLDANPKTLDNYNPIGERGEQRHTPRFNRDEEDMIDGMTPGQAERESEAWPSSCGTVVNAGSVLRDAMRLNRMR